MSNTHGHSNVNYDEKTISYDLNVRIPFVADFIVNRETVEQFMEEMDKKTLDSLRLTTASDYVRFRNLPFRDIPHMINRLQMVLDDLKTLGEQVNKKE